MRLLRTLLLLFLVPLGTAAGAGHAVAATLPFTGTLTLRIWPPGEPPIFPVTFLTVTGGGVALASLGSHVTSFALAGGTFGPISTLVPAPSFPSGGTLSVQGLANQAGSFSAGGGVMGLSGLAKICVLFDPSCAYVSVPVPLTNFGIGGTDTATAPAWNLTIQHSSWTRGAPAALTIHNPVTTVTTPTLPGGFSHGPGSGTSSTGLPGGTVQLVTVSKAYTSLTADYPEFPLWGVLTLQFVPEPAGWLLVVAGSALAALVRRRRD